MDAASQALANARMTRASTPGKIAVCRPEIPISSKHRVGRWAVAGGKKIQPAAVCSETHSKQHLRGAVDIRREVFARSNPRNATEKRAVHQPPVSPAVLTARMDEGASQRTRIYRVSRPAPVLIHHASFSGAYTLITNTSPVMRWANPPSQTSLDAGDPKALARQLSQSSCRTKLPRFQNSPQLSSSAP